MAAIGIDYFRVRGHVSLHGVHFPAAGRWAAAAAALAAVLQAGAQYPGRLENDAKDAPEMRSIAVLEWTGAPGKPKASRLVPVAVLDGGELQDGSIYLARPEPLAVEADVEYVLMRDGKPVGLYDIKNAGQEQGSWVGYGVWKPMPGAKSAARAAARRPRIDDDFDEGDRPVLHRKHHDNEGTASGGSGSGASQPAPDSDRPTLHRNDSSEGSGDAGGPSGEPAPAPDPDRPTLHRHEDTGDSGTSAEDSDRPKLKRGKSQAAADEPYEKGLPGVTDPDRPRLIRGKANADKLDVSPSLMGLPAEMEQVVAVSDAKNRPPHPWNYSWANPADEAKMKAEMEEIARKDLGLTPPPAPAAPAATTTHKRTGRHKAAKPAPPPPPPAPLEDEQFRVFELAYGSGATMVLSAHTAGPLAEQKFVTLIAQPDLYGNVLVLFKNLTDGAHLDYTPRMKLIDAVDAMADNRGELLFELRGTTQRQFALYRVVRGEADRIFLGGGGVYGSENSE